MKTLSLRIVLGLAVGIAPASAPRAALATGCGALEDLTERFVAAYRSGDAAAASAFYADDAVYVGTGGDLTQGREKIRAGLEHEMPAFKDFSARPDESSCSGDLGYERGTFSARLEIPGQPARTLSGRFLIVFRRAGDGSWKIQSQFTSRDRGPGG